MLLHEAAVEVIEVDTHDEVLQVRLAPNLVRFITQKLQQIAVEPPELTTCNTKTVLDSR